MLVVMDATLLIDSLRREAARLFPAHPILVAYAHGSRVSGRPRPESDLDVGYYLQRYREGGRLPLSAEMRLEADLSDALGVEVDLRNLGLAPLDVRGRVLEAGTRVYAGDEVARVGLERDLLGRYHDYKETFLRMHDRRLAATARRGLFP